MASPEPNAPPPDVDELFPPQAKSVDELFPPQVEADRYRRQTLGTSPIQDLIFGDTTVNPIARVLDSFGQGFKQGWGAEPAGLSQESTDYLKKAGIFNDYEQGQKSVIKAANESLIRPAAVGLDAVVRSFNAAFSGSQAGVAQIGEETGHPQLGRDIAAIPEAFMGTPHPTGMPHVDLAKANSLKIIGAGEDGWLGTADAAAPTAEAAAVKAEAVTPKPKGMPVDLFAEPRQEMPAPEATATPEPAVPGAEATSEPAHPIATDVTGKLIAAGRPEAEAQASGQLIASHYQARAERFGGALGTPEELYKAEGADILPGNGAAPTRSAIKPPEGDTGAPEATPPETPTLNGGAAEALKLVDAPEGGVYTPDQIKKGEKYFKAVDPSGNVTAEILIKVDGDTARIEDILNPNAVREQGIGTIGNAQLRGLLNQFLEQHPDVKRITGKRVSGARAGGEYNLLGKHTEVSVPLVSRRGRAAADPQTWSLYEFLAKEGGLKPTADLKSILDGKNPFVPGFGPLLRPTGLTMDEALTRAKENSYVLDPNDIQHVPGAANTGELTKNVNDLQDMVAAESRGQKNYRTDHVQPEAKVNPEQERTSILDALHNQIEADTGAKQHIDPAIEDRVVEIVQKEGGDVHSAFERAIMEDHDQHEALLNERRSAHGAIAGHDHPDSGSASLTGEELARESRTAEPSAQGQGAANGEASRDHGANDRQAADLEFYQKEQTLTPEFKKWFGDSKVVDKEGKPLLVYHGAPDARFIKDTGEFKSLNERYNQPETGEKKAFFFAADRSTAVTYADDRRAFDYQNAEPATIPAYLSLQNPMIIDRRGAKWHGTDSAVKDAKAGGYDGIIIKNVIDTYQAAGRPTDVYVAFDSRQIKSPENSGKFDPNSPRIFDQIKRGKINLRKDAKPIITLFKDANASTFIHETGHQWLEELMADSEHPKAPADLKADAIAVLDWLGVKTADQIKTSHHEKFARGFERYMMEGKAPNQALAGVFAKFKDWLTRIYQTVTRLKSPINDEIRGVFDRLLTLHPEDVKIEPEGQPKTFADIHEADAANTPAEMAHPAAETIQAERDSVAAKHIPEDNNARLEGIANQAERRAAGSAQSASHADAAQPATGEAGNAEASGAVGEGGSYVAPEGPRTRTEPPVSAHDKFPDKAGNIRLDNLNTPEELNQVIRQTAQENGDFQNVRGPVSDAQVLDLAEAAGVDAAFIDSRKLGEAWTAPQIVALRRLLIQSAQSVHDLAKKAAEGAEADVMAYAEAKARHQLIQERVSSVTAEAGRALRAFQSKFTEGVAGDVSSFLKDATGKTLFQLQQEAKFLSKLQTPGQTSKFINDTSKGTFRNAILEYYINALISGPVTHTRYMVSNAINAIFTPLVEIPFGAASGKVREIVKGEPIERVRMGEAGAQLYGLIKGSRDGLSAAIDAFQTGISPALPNEKVSAHFAEASQAIPGKIGRVIRIPSRSVAGIHSFFKALRYEQNVQSLAYRTAANEGLTGDAFANRVAELTTSPTEAMMTDATNNALKELYMSPTEYHSKMGGLVRFTNQNLAAKIVVPFMKIGSQITRNAFIERTPLGLLDRKVRSSLTGELGAGEQDLQAGKIAAGMALMATSVGLMAEGLMTGDGPENPEKRAVWLLSHTPASIQIGEITFKYGNTGPLGMLMRFVANTYETAEHMGDSDIATLAVSFFEGFSKSVLDETFLRGVKDMLDAMFHPKQYGGQYLKSQITNWMPWSVGLSQVARKVDPFSRETHGIWQAAQAKIPYLSESLMPRRDMFGEPIRNGGPNPDYANDPVVKAMDAVHTGIGKLGKKIRGVDLNEQQYDDLARIAGRMAKTKLNAMVNIISNPNIPPAQRVELIHNAISTSRETARTMIMMQNPDIIKQATDAKIEKLRATAH